MEPDQPRLGEKIRFAPDAFVGEHDPAQPKAAAVPKMVTGIVSYINEPHRYYTVEFPVRGVTMRESFKF
jgi:hypothetical protein